MGIKKQEFYEGAALYLLARTGRVRSIRYESPFFLLNDSLWVYLKYSTKGRSPWGFTFMAAEQALLEERSSKSDIVVGLVCGSDGVAGLPYEAYRSIAATRPSAVHIACYRAHNEHYKLKGPDGALAGKIAPSSWQRIIGG